MKKIFVLFALIAATMSASAQEIVKILKSDGTIIEYPASEIAKIYFEQNKSAYKAVDLGLSVMWADCNLGATTPEDTGDYFAWGETEPKDNFDISNYEFSNIGDDIAWTQYDVAATAEGSKWHMPSRSEAQELADKCVWKATTQNGTQGYKVTGPNGNSIFLPITGFYGGTSLQNAETCNYWTSTRAGWSENLAWTLCTEVSGPKMTCWYSTQNNLGRFWGMPIRAVYTKVTAKTGGEGASKANPKDMSHVINCPTYDDDKYYGWNGTDPTNASYGCFEQYNKNFDNYQAINGLPEGWYTLSVQGYYRMGYSYNDYEYFATGTVKEHSNATFYAKSSTQTASACIVCASTGATTEKLSSSVSIVGDGLLLPNDMQAADKWFKKGYYNNDPIKMYVNADGNLTIGFKKPKTIEGDWVIVDNWKLTYYGQDEPEVKEDDPIEPPVDPSQDIIYEEPCLTWGLDVAGVKSALKDYKLLEEEESGDNVFLVYEGKYKEYCTFYEINSKSGLDMAEVVVMQDACTFEELHEQLESRYIYLGPIGDTELFISEDETVIVFVEANDEIGVYYIDYINNVGSDMLYEEPYTEWGASISTVKSAMDDRGYSLYQENTANGTTSLIYEGMYEEIMSVYDFDTSKQLYSARIFFDDAAYTLDQVVDYLKEDLSYEADRVIDGVYTFVSSDLKSFVMVGQLEGAIMIQYVDVNRALGNHRSMSMEGINMAKMREHTAALRAQSKISPKMQKIIREHQGRNLFKMFNK